MKLIECTKCGSNELFDEKGYVVCAYCRLKFVPSPEDVSKKGAIISVYDDIQELLAKCTSDPENRRRYASLILDLDPTNTDVLRYLR
jgi:uncharacterized Zn finger protein (UPF0148 family)